MEREAVEVARDREMNTLSPSEPLSVPIFSATLASLTFWRRLGTSLFLAYSWFPITLHKGCQGHLILS